eukprot:scaffold30418_cov66-Phaeocystis_antarctica.AAC.3
MQNGTARPTVQLSTLSGPPFFRSAERLRSRVEVEPSKRGRGGMARDNRNSVHTKRLLQPRRSLRYLGNNRSPWSLPCARGRGLVWPGRGLAPPRCTPVIQVAHCPVGLLALPPDRPSNGRGPSDKLSVQASLPTPLCLLGAQRLTSLKGPL